MIYDAAAQKVQRDRAVSGVGVQIQYTSDVAQAIMPNATYFSLSADWQRPLTR